MPALIAPSTVRAAVDTTTTTKTKPKKYAEVAAGSRCPSSSTSSPPPRPAIPAESANATIFAFAGLMPIDCAAVSLPRSASR